MPKKKLVKRKIAPVRKRQGKTKKTRPLKEYSIQIKNQIVIDLMIAIFDTYLKTIKTPKLLEIFKDIESKAANDANFKIENYVSKEMHLHQRLAIIPIIKDFIKQSMFMGSIRLLRQPTYIRYVDRIAQLSQVPVKTVMEVFQAMMTIMYVQTINGEDMITPYDLWRESRRESEHWNNKVQYGFPKQKLYFLEMLKNEGFLFQSKKDGD